MSVAESSAGALKLILDDKVSALTLGGNSEGELLAVAGVAEEKQVLFCALSEVRMENLKFTINAGSPTKGFSDTQMVIATDIIKPKTAAILLSDIDSMRLLAEYKEPQLEAADIKLVYKQIAPQDTVDFSSYLTRIKYEKPDVLFLDLNNQESYIVIAKQMLELGGWDDIKVVAITSGAAAVNQPGAQGWYLATRWYPGLQNPGALKFEKDYQAMFGRLPSPNAVYFYDPVSIAIKAIELAGTSDPIKVAEAAFSGNLEWDAPEGHIRFGEDGSSNMTMNMSRIENKTVVPVSIPE